jgi:uroporphyrinogen decarboxylase
MTPRRRYVETLTFGRPDRIPFSPGHPRESTLAAWRTQGLPEGADWHAHLLETLGIPPEPAQPRTDLGVDFRCIPRFEEKVLEHKGGHYVVQDWKGNICEISDRYDVTYLRDPKDFVTRRWLKCPVETREDWERMKERYRADGPGRFPTDFQVRCEELLGRDYVLTLSLPGPFWQLREWCGFENLCLWMIEQPDFVKEMAEFWEDFVARLLARIIDHASPDLLHISEDMAFKGHSLISPAMIERFFRGAYVRWSLQAVRLGRVARVPLRGVDSDGYVADLIPIWMDSGINVCDPMEVAAGNDLAEYRRRFGRRMAYQGGVDKRAIARGGRAIRQELARLEPVVRDGGYIPGCDHGVPADVSWPNFVDYSRLLAQMTGWL